MVEVNDQTEKEELATQLSECFDGLRVAVETVESIRNGIRHIGFDPRWFSGMTETWTNSLRKSSLLFQKLRWLILPAASGPGGESIHLLVIQRLRQLRIGVWIFLEEVGKDAEGTDNLSRSLDLSEERIEKHWDALRSIFEDEKRYPCFDRLLTVNRLEVELAKAISAIGYRESGYYTGISDLEDPAPNDPYAPMYYHLRSVCRSKGFVVADSVREFLNGDEQLFGSSNTAASRNKKYWDWRPKNGRKS